MKVSKLGIKTAKNRGSDEFESIEIALQGTMLKRHSAGVYGLGNLLHRVRTQIAGTVRKHLDRYDCAEISLPVLQPKQLWVDSGRWDGYVASSAMYHFKGRKGEYCLAPTAEEIVFDFIRNNIVSYKDLDVNVYQIGTKYRDEIRVRGGLMRSKEFMMKDGYSFHGSSEALDQEYERIKQCYHDIFNDLGIDIITVKALSGDMGGKKSEEFMMLSPVGEDKILYNQKLNVGINTEVLENQETLDMVKAELGVDNFDDFTLCTCIELGHIFQLGQFYSKSMNGKFTDANGKQEYFYMGCYGLGISRILGAIMEKNHDSDGLIWDDFLTPYSLGIVSFNEDSYYNSALNIYNNLMQDGQDILWDDRDISIGQKMKDMFLMGIPYIAIIGKEFDKTGKVEIERRRDKAKFLVQPEKIADFIASTKAR